jgi:hypothetical protein
VLNSGLTPPTIVLELFSVLRHFPLALNLPEGFAGSISVNSFPRCESIKHQSYCIRHMVHKPVHVLLLGAT